MTRLRFTIAGLMAIVLFAGLAFAALRGSNAFWASATFSVAVLTISVAIAVACVRKDDARMPCAGFAIAGSACLVIWLATPNTVGFVSGPPHLLVFWGLYKLQPYINPTVTGGEELIAYVQICHSLEAILFGLVGAALGRYFGGQDD
jgi:hypothetical protein